MKPKDHILQAAEPLSAGDSCRSICPFCQDKEATMSITREVAIVLYHCYRASCGKSGVLGAKLSPGKSKKEFKPKIFDKVVHPLDEDAEEYLRKYELDPDSGVAGWLPEERRLSFSLLNASGYMWGTLTKAIDKGVKPKTILYKMLDIPSIHFSFPSFGWILNEPGRLVLVEDVMSATKLNDYVDTAAILGTHLSEEMVMYLKSLNYKEIRLMFDRDATAKALGYVNKYKGVLNLSVLEVSKPYSDPKDIPRKELEEMFK